MRLTRRRLLAGGACLATCSRPGLAAGDRLVMQAAYINDAEFLGYFIGLQDGLYRDAGLTLDYLPGGPDVIPESALLSGKADLALTTPDSTVNAIMRQDAPFRIIAAQFQKNPMGIISLDSNPVHDVADLAGKTLSVSAVSMVLARAWLKYSGLPHGAVRIVPDSQSDPTALLTGAVDAALGFVTDFPFVVAARGRKPVSFLLADHGLPLFNDTVVVTETVLKTRRPALLAWLRASRKGWEQNFRDPDLYPARYHDSWLQPAGRSVAYDSFSNQAYRGLMQAPGGLFSMSEEAIAQNIDSLGKLGLRATRAMFDTSLLAEIA